MKLRVLNLSRSIVTPSRLNMKFQRFTFPAGEEHIKIEPEAPPDKIIITSNMTPSSDLVVTFLATDAVRAMFPSISVELLSPYFSYARQDRRMVKGEPLSVKVMADMVNSMRYAAVHVLDPHSDVTTALVNNIKIIDNAPFVRTAWNAIEDSSKCLVSPDAGFEKKAFRLATEMNIDSKDVVYGTKKRDVATGKLSGFGFSGNVNGRACVIVDDICDSGGTFIGLAQNLREGGAKSVHLVVSHGIFSKGVSHLLNNGIESIYTTDSCYRDNANNSLINVIGLNEFSDILKD